MAHIPFETEGPRGMCRQCKLIDRSDFWPEPDLCDLCAQEQDRPQWGLFVAGVAAGLVVLAVAQVVMAVLS
jgi:hypothetical protein